MLPDIYTGYVLRAGEGWSVDLLTADCEDLENLSASETDATKFKHQQEGTISSPCADGSLKLSDLLELPVAKGPLEGTWSKMKKQKKWKLFFYICNMKCSDDGR